MSQLEEQVAATITDLLAVVKLLGNDELAAVARRVVCIGAAGCIEAVGPRATAEAFYRMADNLAVETEARR